MLVELLKKQKARPDPYASKFTARSQGTKKKTAKKRGELLAKSADIALVRKQFMKKLKQEPSRSFFAAHTATVNAGNQYKINEGVVAVLFTEIKSDLADAVKEEQKDLFNDLDEEGVKKLLGNP